MLNIPHGVKTSWPHQHPFRLLEECLPSPSLGPLDNKFQSSHVEPNHCYQSLPCGSYCSSLPRHPPSLSHVLCQQNFSCGRFFESLAYICFHKEIVMLINKKQTKTLRSSQLYTNTYFFKKIITWIWFMIDSSYQTGQFNIHYKLWRKEKKGKKESWKPYLKNMEFMVCAPPANVPEDISLSLPSSKQCGRFMHHIQGIGTLYIQSKKAWWCYPYLSFLWRFCLGPFHIRHCLFQLLSF